MEVVVGALDDLLCFGAVPPRLRTYVRGVKVMRVPGVFSSRGVGGGHGRLLVRMGSMVA